MRTVSDPKPADAGGRSLLCRIPWRRKGVGVSSSTVCPRCGGAIGSNASGKRACTCARSGPAVATLDATVAGVHKICCVCGVDVTNARRMKDAATRRYWCYECGIAEKSHHSHGMNLDCPECKKSFPPLKLIKYKDHYICEGCYLKHVPKSKKPAAA